MTCAGAANDAAPMGIGSGPEAIMVRRIENLQPGYMRPWPEGRPGTRILRRRVGPEQVEQIALSPAGDHTEARKWSVSLRLLAGNTATRVGGTLDAGGKAVSVTAQENYEREAPKEPSTIVATINREHGVQFKLKAHDQDTLEGIKEFTCRFEASPGWRGDWVSVVCKAHSDGTHKSLAEWALALGLYLKGEGSAKHDAEALANVQSELDADDHAGKQHTEELRARYDVALKAMKNHSN